MSPTAVIVMMAVVTYGPRLAGFELGGRALGAFWLRFLRFVPIATFAALIAPSLGGAPGELPARLAAAVVAAVVLWRFRSLWLGLAVGMALFWGLRALP